MSVGWRSFRHCRPGCSPLPKPKAPGWSEWSTSTCTGARRPAPNRNPRLRRAHQEGEAAWPDGHRASRRAPLEPFYESSDRLGAWPHTDPTLRKRIGRGRDDGAMDTEVVQLRAGNRLVSDITQVILQFCRDRGDGLRHIFVPHAAAGVALISGAKGAIT